MIWVKISKSIMLSGKKGQGKCTLVNHFLAYTFDFKNYDLNRTTINNNSNLLMALKII